MIASSSCQLDKVRDPLCDVRYNKLPSVYFCSDISAAPKIKGAYKFIAPFSNYALPFVQVNQLSNDTPVLIRFLTMDMTTTTSDTYNSILYVLNCLCPFGHLL